MFPNTRTQCVQDYRAILISRTHRSVVLLPRDERYPDTPRQCSRISVLVIMCDGLCRWDNAALYGHLLVPIIDVIDTQ